MARELRIASRKGSLYWSRFSFGVIGVGIGIYVLPFAKEFGFASSGRILFYIFTMLAFAYCVLGGIKSSCDCISSEKREGTLGLLFLTNLKGYDIILGKLASNGLIIFYSFLAVFPILSIGFLLGGVTGKEFFHAFLGLMNVMFFTQATGMLASTLFVKARRSFGYSFLILFLLMAGIPFAGMILRNLGHPVLSNLIILFNPSLPLQSQGNFWMALAVSHALGWMFLAIAAWRVPDCWQEKHKTSGGNWHERLKQFNYGEGAGRKKIRERFLARNPFFWLVSRRRFGPLGIWGIMAAIGVLYVVVISVCKNLQISMPVEMLLFISVLTHILFLSLYAGSASESLEQYRRDGSLGFLLCSTPITVPEIISGQWLGMLRLYLWPLIVLLLSDLFQIGFLALLMGEQKTAEILLFIMAIFALNLIPIGWRAMWYAVRAAKPGNPFISIFFEIVVFPFIISMSLIGPLLKISFVGENLLLAWFIMNAAWDFFLIRSSRSNIRRNLRVYIVPDLQGAGGFWENTGRSFGRAWGRFRKRK